MPALKNSKILLFLVDKVYDCSGILNFKGKLFVINLMCDIKSILHHFVFIKP